MLIFLAACGGSGTPIPGGPVPPNDPNNPNQGIPADDGTCTYVLNESITIDSVLVNTSAACDYRVTGSFSVSNSTLTVEPGVTIRFTQDTNIRIEDAGSISAVGTPDKRITFEGESPIRGFARGIFFTGGSYPSRIEYADFRYLGKLDDGYYKFQNAAISGLQGGELAFKNNTVMGSNFYGAEFDRYSLIQLSIG